MATLRTHDLTKSYGGRTVVRGVNLEVASGEIVGLLGPNGAGKTTTFYMTVGLTAPDSGRVELDGHDVTDDPMYVRARKGIGYLPQEPSIFRGLTVEQNILAILETMELDAAARRARLRELLAELNLTPLAQAPAYTLSGGERRRAEITRALVDLAQVHPARRAVCRHRSDRRHRHPEDHFSPARPRHRRAHHRPQRPRDAAHHRSRLHRARRRDLQERHAGIAWPPTKRSGGFIWGPSSGWTKIRPGNCISACAAAEISLDASRHVVASSNCNHNNLADTTAHGYPAETPHQARSEADPDAVAAAGDQAAADVDARAVGSAQPGDGREPDARGGADRGSAAGRGRRPPREDRKPSQTGRTRPTPGTTRTTSTSSATTSTTATGRARRRRSRSCRRSRTRSRRRARSPIT